LINGGRAKRGKDESRGLPAAKFEYDAAPGSRRRRLHAFAISCVRDLIDGQRHEPSDALGEARLAPFLYLKSAMAKFSRDPCPLASRRLGRKTVEPFARRLKRRNITALELTATLVDEGPKCRVMLEEPIEEPHVAVADRQELETPLPAFGHDPRRRLVLPSVLFKVRFRYRQVDHFHGW
jgi:hypothetical protein